MPTIPTKQISSTVEEALLKEAQAMTGAGQSETVRQALKHFVDTHHCAAAPCAPAAPVAMAAVAPAVAAGTAPKKRQDMTSTEAVSSFALMRKTRNALSDAIEYLTGEAAVADVGTQQQLRIRIGDLQGQRTKVEAKMTAYLANDLTMTPPSSATVQRISELAQQVSELTQSAQQADMVVTAVNKVVEIWTDTVPQN